MSKFKQITASVLVLGLVIPGAALANGRDKEDWGNRGMKIRAGLSKKLGWHWGKHRVGTVQSVSGASFEMKLADDTVFTVNVNSDTKFMKPFGGNTDFADIQVNDKVRVKGEVEGSTIDARLVVVMPPNTHPAAARGTVKAVDGSTITVESQHHGVEFDVKINTDVQTQFQKVGSTTTTTIADVQVGAKVKVKGLWNEVLDILNAIKVKIF